MKYRIAIVAALAVALIMIICLWMFKSPAISSESMGRPYVVEETEEDLIVTLDESYWEYRGDVDYYQFFYKLEGEECWAEETPMASKLAVIPGVSPGGTYEIRVDGLNKRKKKIGESNILTYEVIDEEETDY